MAKKKAEKTGKAIAVHKHERPAPPLSTFGEFDRLFDRMMRPLGSAFWPRLSMKPSLIKEFEWAPSIDVFERNGKTVVRADLPGVKKDDVDVSVEGGMLVIHGCREEAEEEKGADYYVSERAAGEFCRTLRLPEGVTAEKIEASYKDGVLEVTFPNPKPVESKGVKVKVS